MKTDVAAMELETGSQVRTAPFPVYRILLIGTIVYFLAFGILMTNLGGQPDQAKHLYFSNRFARTWGIPQEESTSPYRVTGNVYLYYWLNGAALKIYRFVVPAAAASQEGFLLRLISLCMSAMTLFYTYKLASKVTGNHYAGVLAAFFMANTLMFVFVSSGVSYDNFMDWASAAAIYHLVNIYKREDFVRNTALMGMWLGLGALAKEQTLLLAFLLFVAWLAYTIRARKGLALVFSRTNIALASVFLVSSVLVLALYGVNVVRYRHLIPTCPQVKPAAACTYLSERRPLYHPVDVQGIWNIRESFQNPFTYALRFWIFQMLSSIWGVLSHNTYVPWLSVSLHGCLILWAGLCVLRYWKAEDRIPTVLLVLLLAYTGYVLLMNYWNELHYDFRHFAVQGRYLFPVLGVLFAVMINYFLRIRSLFLRRMTLALSMIIYFAGGLGLFIFRYSQVFSYWRF